MQEKTEKQLLAQLEVIKKILLLMTITSGASTVDIAKVLGVTTRRVQQMIPTKNLKKQ